MDIFQGISEVMSKKTCIVAVGSELYRDDAVGLYLVNRVLRGAHSDRVTFIMAEDVIENYVFKIAGEDCDNVMIIDAVKSDSEVGSVVFGPLGEFNELIGDFSTHKLSLKLSGKILEDHNKKTYLLGIEAGDLDFGNGLTTDVKKSADILADFLINTINNNPKEHIYEQ